MPSAVLGQNGLKPRILRFPAHGGPVGQNMKCKNVAHFWGEMFWGVRISPQKVPLAPGNCVFPRSAQPRDFSRCQGPSLAKIAQNTRVLRFPARGGRVGENVKRKKVRASVVTFFVISGTLAPGNCVSPCFQPAPMICPSAKMALNPRISRFPAPWGSGWPKRTV